MQRRRSERVFGTMPQWNKEKGVTKTMPNKIIRVGSRESVLAVAQTELVMETIRKNHPEVELELVTMKTTGDIILDKSLDKIGGKGLFVKELDKALMEGRIDISVHSLKDMPMETPDELPILAYSKRGNPFDCLVLPEGVDSWDHTTPAGCSGHRRRVQLQKLFGDIPIKGIRGNIHTRLNKLDSGEYGALVLACSGLARVGLSSRIHHVFTLEEMIPSAGQGILAVQGRKGEDYSWLMETDDPISRIQATAERAFVRTLDGGCSSPIAAYAQVSGQEVLLTGLYYHDPEGVYVTGTKTDRIENAQKLGETLAEELKSRFLCGCGVENGGL